MKVDYKKDFKELYAPKTVPSIVNVPKVRFIVVEGEGDPNGKEFGDAIGALYSLTYAVKMSYKSDSVPKGYYEYTVFPLEGVWDIIDKSKPISDKSNFKYRIMIRQPDFLTKELFERFLTATKNKKPNPSLNRVSYEESEEGLCCQMLHLGSYDDEPASFKSMEEYCREKGYERLSKVHREIYLSDPRKAEKSKLKTILRFQIKN